MTANSPEVVAVREPPAVRRPFLVGLALTLMAAALQWTPPIPVTRAPMRPIAVLPAVTAPRSKAAAVDSAALERNLALSRKIHVNGTPAILLEDGNRIPGAVGAVELERRLQALSAPASKS